MAIVAIDSMVLVWGIRQEGTQEQLQRVRWLFEELQQQDAQIIVPTIAIAEYLTPVARHDHAAVIHDLSQRFIIPVFDVRAASLAAHLFNVGNNTRPKNIPGGRTCLRADSIIIASAHASGATTFYSDDAQCRALAKEYMTAADLPTIPPTLFSPQ